MKKNIFKVLAAVLAVAMISSMAVVPALAFTDGTNYTPVNGTSTTFNKYLIIPEGAHVPSVTFNFTAAAGTGRSVDTHDNEVMEVLPGVDAANIVISAAVFGPSDTTATAAESTQDVARQDRTNVKFETGKNEQYATHQVTVDFSGVSFPEPGIYRYIITENSSAADIVGMGIVNDDDVDRVLDVYVTDDGNGTLVVSSYALHKIDDDVIIDSNMGSHDVATAGGRLADKTDGFTNEWIPSNLVFAKEVTGNQGSRDKWFKFHLHISNVPAGDQYTVSIAADQSAYTVDGNASAVVGTNPATIWAANTPNVLLLTADANGEIDQDFYLQHGQYIAVQNLPQNAIYTVTEDEEDYAKTAAIMTGYTDATTGTLSAIDADHDNIVKTSWTNNRNGIIPTGVVLGLSSILGVAALAGAGIVIFRKKDEE